MIKLNGITRSFNGPKGKVVALNKVSMSIEAGELLAVKGPSGCGLALVGWTSAPKTTEMRCSKQYDYSSLAQRHLLAPMSTLRVLARLSIWATRPPLLAFRAFLARLRWRL